MSFWTPQQPMHPVQESQYSLPLPPNLLRTPAASAPTPPPPTLPAPPLPSSLDSARLRLTLDCVKLDLNGAREALSEVLALREAVASLTEEVRLANEERDATAAALEARIVGAVRAALEEQLSSMRDAVTSAAERLTTKPSAKHESIEALQASVARDATAARSRLEQVEQRLRGELATAGQRANTLLERKVQLLDKRRVEADRASETQAGVLQRLGEQVAKVEARLGLLDSRPTSDMATNSRNQVVQANGAPTSTRADPSFAATGSSPPRIVTKTVRDPASAGAAGPPASSSSDGPGPSPPSHRPRRFLPALQNGTPRQTTSLPLHDSFAAARAAASTARAATAPSGAHATHSPTVQRALARSSTKRRVIEQDESLPDAEPDEGAGEGGEGVKRRRVIEQDATPTSTPGDERGGAAGGVRAAEQERVQEPKSGGDVEEEEEPDTL